MSYQVRNPEQMKKQIRMSGYNATGLAKAVGVSRTYISALIHQRSNASKPIAILIGYLLDVDYNRLFLALGVSKKTHKRNEMNV